MSGKHDGEPKKDKPFEPQRPTDDKQGGGRHGGGNGNAGGGGDGKGGKK
ncbi:hypothetical protein [Nonomuraea angiospora]